MQNEEHPRKNIRISGSQIWFLKTPHKNKKKIKNKKRQGISSWGALHLNRSSPYGSKIFVNRGPFDFVHTGFHHEPWVGLKLQQLDLFYDKEGDCAALQDVKQPDVEHKLKGDDEKLPPALHPPQLETKRNRLTPAVPDRKNHKALHKAKALPPDSL